MGRAQAWDERYRAGRHASEEPDSFVVSTRELWIPTQPAEALDAACGAGRNSIYLARNGYRVSALDVSSEALRLTRERAGDLDIVTRQVDLEAATADLGKELFDLVCSIQFFHRPLFPRLRRAVRPGGLLLFKTYTEGQLAFADGPRDPAHLLETGELQRLVSDWEILRYEEEREARATAAVLARKLR
jgi:SAM-dependent methyltransferase